MQKIVDQAARKGAAAALENFTESNANMPEGDDGMSRYRERVSINGRLQWISGNTRQELFEKAAALMNGGAEPTKGSPLFNGYAEEWFETIRKPTVKYRRYLEGRGILHNYLLPYFEGKRLDEIKYKDVAAYFAQPSIQRLAASTAGNHGEMLNMIFRMAVKDELTDRNPAVDFKQYLPKRKTEREALSAETAREIIDKLPRLKDADRLFISLLIFTGIRRGEALGLQVKDIDRAAKRLHVRQGVTFEHNRPKISPPKTKQSVRTIPIMDGFPFELLEGMKPDDFVLGGAEPWTETTLRRCWERIREKIGLNRITPHIFRHTYATLAIGAGLDLKTVQGLLGHATAYTTANIYAHIQQEKVLAADRLLNSIYVTEM